MKRLYKNALAYIEGKFVKTDILVQEGKIAAFAAPCCSFEDIECIDCSGAYLVPGFIDIHTHGAAGVDVNRADESAFQSLADFYASRGVCAFLASVLTDSEENTFRALNTINSYRAGKHGGAVLLGAHLEGPFLSPAKKGAMPEQYLVQPDFALLRRYIATGAVKYITLAPELTGALPLIEAASRHMRVALGHSQGDYAVTKQAITAGAVAATHTFNAMQAIDRVEPHILGAVLDSDIYCEIIADGKHVHPANIRLLYQVKGNQRVIAITDSIEAAGMPDGTYKLGVNDVTVANGEAFLSGTASRAGSVLTMDKALKNLISFLDIPLEEALPMLTENPADLLGLNKGYIRIGYDADFVLLDKECNVVKTYISN